MIKIIRGILVICGIMLIFMLLTACTTDSIFAKKDNTAQVNRSSNKTTVSEEYTYDDDITKDYSIASAGEAEVYGSNDVAGENFYQKGYASWYGREFHGRKTASGDKFDMNKLTAAHKKLPFGTKILVRNLENGKTVSATVNDRGPYHDNRILDLSYAAAKKIGIIESGEAKVGITILKGGNEEIYGKSGDNSIEAVAGESDEGFKAGSSRDYFLEGNPSEGANYLVQAGAFYSKRNAEKFQKRLEKLVENPVVLVDDNDLYKVRIDNIVTRAEADKVKRLLEREDIPSYIMEK